jgi:hypothetical protein
MQYLQKGQPNTLVLNINNNSRYTFTGYTLLFTHVMSQEEKTYNISTSNPAQFNENIRYCNIYLPVNTDDLNYEGQYTLNIYGQPNNINVFKGMAVLEIGTGDYHFTEYISPNETNENYIYIPD